MIIKKKLSLFSSGFLNFIYIYAPIIIIYLFKKRSIDERREEEEEEEGIINNIPPA